MYEGRLFPSVCSGLQDCDTAACPEVQTSQRLHGGYDPPRTPPQSQSTDCSFRRIGHPSVPAARSDAAARFFAASCMARRTMKATPGMRGVRSMVQGVQDRPGPSAVLGRRDTLKAERREHDNDVRDAETAGPAPAGGLARRSGARGGRDEWGGNGCLRHEDLLCRPPVLPSGIGLSACCPRTTIGSGRFPIRSGRSPDASRCFLDTIAVRSLQLGRQRHTRCRRRASQDREVARTGLRLERESPKSVTTTSSVGPLARARRMAEPSDDLPTVTGRSGASASRGREYRNRRRLVTGPVPSGGGRRLAPVPVRVP